ncbi:TPA: hypothetical protein TX924_000947 [Streptococcus suis]|uniref:DUF859 family phage minor structural protein n=1 Tax=Streptococcus suis TaxID=1307 RepID=UPI0025B14943|nr:DUF859 family phage minor structural protein [Streptococcus suis]MDN2949062.1 DUF859 family phage minor structural protein [Streptococcus suis]HEL1563470.1 hypothetical protein [Streptococcus suis]HEL1908945.1 hypothetical protein [Streptococcus suis]HEL1917769.1 hypothetical protein [Streptococcus suis]
MGLINYSGNWQGYLEYSTETVSQNIAANQSTVRVKVWVGCRWDIQFHNTYGNTVSVTVNGANQSLTVGSLVVNNSKKYLGHLDFVVNHNQNGTGVANVSFSSNMSNIAYSNLNFGNASGSYSHALTTIPRSSSLSVGVGTIGSAITININRQSNSFTHTLRYAWGSKSGTIATNVGTSHSWTIPNDFANDIPNATSGTGTLYVDTFSGSTKTGTQQVTFTANVPASMKPTFSGITLTDTNTVVRSLLTGNNFLQIISNIQVTFNGHAGTYGSTITGFKAELVNKNQVTNSNGGTLGIMNFSGSATIRASVFDSRGRQSDTRDVTINVIGYFAPVLSYTATRTRENPNIIQIVRNAKIAPIMFSGSQKNVMTLTFKVAPLGSSTYAADNGSATGTYTTTSSLTNAAANMAGNYPANKSFTIIGTLSDKFTSVEFSATVATESVVMSYDKDGRVGIGKIANDAYKAGSLDVKGDIYAEDKPIQQYQLTSNVGGGLNSPATFGKDLNKILTPGIWQIGADFANNPLGAFSILECYKLHTSNECIQRVTSTSGFMAVREYGHDNVWRPWRYVAQTSSVPTKNADHPMLQEKPLKSVTQGFPYGLNATITRKDNLVTVTLNRRITNIDVFENRRMMEKIPVGYRPTAQVHLVFVPNSGSFTKSPSILHLNADGTIDMTNGTSGRHVYTGTVSYVTNDAYPS